MQEKRNDWRERVPSRSSTAEWSSCTRKRETRPPRAPKVAPRAQMELEGLSRCKLLVRSVIEGMSLMPSITRCVLCPALNGNLARRSRWRRLARQSNKVTVRVRRKGVWRAKERTAVIADLSVPTLALGPEQLHVVHTGDTTTDG